MIELLEQNKELIGIVANVATFITLLGLVVAFFDYRHSIKVAERAEQRAAIELAAKLATHFGLELQRNTTTLLEQIDASKCEFAKHCKVSKTERGLSVDVSEVTQEDRDNIQPHQAKITDILNSLEGFSIPFAEGVADDRVGFVACGRSFVIIIKVLAPYYSLSNLQDYYRSSQAIYTRWSRKVEVEDERRKDAQALKEVLVMSTSLINERLKSRVFKAVSDWCLKRFSS